MWIWGKPINGFTPEGEPMKVLVLDTEGLGALDEDSNHDATMLRCAHIFTCYDVRIFSLAILLSSFFFESQISDVFNKLDKAMSKCRRHCLVSVCSWKLICLLLWEFRSHNCAEECKIIVFSRNFCFFVLESAWNWVIRKVFGFGMVNCWISY